MTMQTDPSGARATHLAELAIKRGYLDRTQLRVAIFRQTELARGGIKFSLNQTLLERRFLSLDQFKLLMQEAEKSPPTPVETTQNSKTFGQYRIITTLADKGQCKVLKAEDLRMGRTVVLKILPRTLMSNVEKYERFKREIKVAGRLVHPNIVAAYGAEEIAGNPVMVLEFVEGETLQERLEREGNIPEIEAWQIAREVAKGLDYAAENGIVHRNIKPDNIIFSSGGRVKILDMGCAKVLDNATELTLPGTTIGTPFYMSPEQAMGSQTLDFRSDIYSLGCTVYHMLTGSVPFVANHCAEVMHQHVRGPRPDPRSLLPEISAHSVPLLHRIMAINPAARPASAAELLAEICELMHKLPDEPVAVRPMRQVIASDAEVAVPLKIEATELSMSRYERFLNYLKVVFQ